MLCQEEAASWTLLLAMLVESLVFPACGLARNPITSDTVSPFPSSLTHTHMRVPVYFDAVFTCFFPGFQSHSSAGKEESQRDPGKN